MAKLSQKQLDEMAKARKAINDESGINSPNRMDLNINSGSINNPPQAKILNEIMGDTNTSLYKYTLPESGGGKREGDALPYVEPSEYPELKVRGNASRDRQAKPIKFYLLKEMEYILKNIDKGNNKTATLNFLVWVGLQTLKGMNQSIDIRIHDDTYADGSFIEKYMNEYSID